jgi:hypothetical protein
MLENPTLTTSFDRVFTTMASPYRLYS